MARPTSRSRSALQGWITRWTTKIGELEARLRRLRRADRIREVRAEIADLRRKVRDAKAKLKPKVKPKVKPKAKPKAKPKKRRGTPGIGVVAPIHEPPAPVPPPPPAPPPSALPFWGELSRRGWAVYLAGQGGAGEAESPFFGVDAWRDELQDVSSLPRPSPSYWRADLEVPASQGTVEVPSTHGVSGLAIYLARDSVLRQTVHWHSDPAVLAQTIDAMVLAHGAITVRLVVAAGYRPSGVGRATVDT